MNRVILVGRFAKDPELRTTQNGKSVASFSIAVDRRFKQEGQPTADFFNVVAWGKPGEIICRYMGKGRQIAVNGRLQSRSYDAQDGSKRYVTEVILEEFDFVGYKNENKESSNRTQTTSPQNGNPLEFDEDFHLMADDDEVPF